jgi:hypothetical protein
MEVLSRSMCQHTVAMISMLRKKINKAFQIDCKNNQKKTETPTKVLI